MMKPGDFLIELQKAVEEFRFADVPTLLDHIDPSEFDGRQTAKALSLIRRKRLFTDLEKATERFIQCGNQAPLVHRQHVQALLDQNRVVEAVSILKNLPPELRNDSQEGPELCGLTGRAFKQLYINEGGIENLLGAIREYQPCWLDRKGDHRWHGINLVALLDRAEREGVDVGATLKKNGVATAILAEIDDLEQNAKVWDYGTAMEASIALKDYDGALRWARKYARHPEADAFELGSTLRQMKELWCLQGTDIGKKLFPVLEYELLQRQGAELQVTSLTIDDKSGFQAVYGDEASVPIDWMVTMLERCTAVARVSNSATGEAVGTGFLMRGGDIRTDWGEAPVFVTNSHVISNRPEDKAPLKAGDGSAEFTRLDARPKVELGDILFTSPKEDLDVTVLRVELLLSGSSVLRPAKYLPALPKDGDKPQRIYVIGHPNGRELAITLYDNSLVAYPEHRYVHYRSPTEEGHSGSPVFTREWKLIALHHRARKELQVNEGILFEPIRVAVTSA